MPPPVEVAAERALTVEKVALEEMHSLVAEGENLDVAVEELDYLEGMATEAVGWLKTADALEASTATLDEVQKCVKQYGKINLLSERVEGLRERAGAGVAWLDAARELFRESAIQLGSLQLILSSDGDPIYCVCRQPDDLQRLMIECEHCEIWYHINCLGISPAKAKQFEKGLADFKCPECCARDGVKYPFDPRVKEAPLKKLPSAGAAAALLREADALTVSVEEADLLRAAVKRSKGGRAASCRVSLGARARRGPPRRAAAADGGGAAAGGGDAAAEAAAAVKQEGCRGGRRRRRRRRRGRRRRAQAPLAAAQRGR